MGSVNAMDLYGLYYGVSLCQIRLMVMAALFGFSFSIQSNRCIQCIDSIRT
jgi:hypothetical protein